jgi:hypothetical protein
MHPPLIPEKHPMCAEVRRGLVWQLGVLMCSDVLLPPCLCPLIACAPPPNPQPTPQAIEALRRCHKDHSIAMWWGACNDAKFALARCLAAEKTEMRCDQLRRRISWLLHAVCVHAVCPCRCGGVSSCSLTAVSRSKNGLFTHTANPKPRRAGPSARPGPRPSSKQSGSATRWNWSGGGWPGGGSGRRRSSSSRKEAVEERQRPRGYALQSVRLN